MVIPNDYNRRKMEAHVNLFQTDPEQFSWFAIVEWYNQ